MNIQQLFQIETIVELLGGTLVQQIKKKGKLHKKSCLSLKIS